MPNKKQPNKRDENGFRVYDSLPDKVPKANSDRSPPLRCKAKLLLVDVSLCIGCGGHRDPAVPQCPKCRASGIETRPLPQDEQTTFVPLQTDL